jgi:hypothetical protein
VIPLAEPVLIKGQEVVYRVKMKGNFCGFMMRKIPVKNNVLRGVLLKIKIFKKIVSPVGGNV